MQVARPVFINGLSRGGTTLLLNLLGSHPDLAMVGETHKVFKGCRQNDAIWRVAAKCLMRDLPILTATLRDYFSPRQDRPRPRLSPALRRHVDRCLFAEKLRRHPHLNRDKGPGRPYSRQELIDARVLGKNLDGAIYLSDVFAEMYPDATFITLVRHGLAVCEGHTRRGISAESIGQRYQRLMTKALDDADRSDRHLVVRFEDLLSNPTDVMVRCCQLADLDIWRLGQVRLQRRKLLQENGRHQSAGKEWEVVWSPLSKLSGHYDQQIDDRQIANLGAADREAFLREAAPVMERLGYIRQATPALRHAA